MAYPYRVDARLVQLSVGVVGYLQVVKTAAQFQFKRLRVIIYQLRHQLCFGSESAFLERLPEIVDDILHVL